MSTQLHEAYGIVRARTHGQADRALLREARLAQAARRRPSLGRRLLGR